MPYLILVGGGSCSGKSTFAKQLAALLENDFTVTVFSQDDYYRDLSGIPEEVLKGHNFDEPAAVEQDLLLCDLKKLLTGDSVFKKVYNYKTHSRKISKEKLKTAEIIIMEGIFALNFKNINRISDLKIYIDVSAEIRRQRRIERDVSDRNLEEDDVIRMFDCKVEPMHREYIQKTSDEADIIINSFDLIFLKKLSGKIRKDLS